MYSEEWLKYILFPLITLVLLSAILTAFKNEKDAGQLQVLCGVGLGLVVMNYFQRIFGLPQTGIVDYPTWHKISEIYVGVSRIAEGV